jgi:hypothetical protein
MFKREDDDNVKLAKNFSLSASVIQEERKCTLSSLGTWLNLATQMEIRGTA